MPGHEATGGAGGAALDDERLDVVVLTRGGCQIKRWWVVGLDDKEEGSIWRSGEGRTRGRRRGRFHRV